MKKRILISTLFSLFILFSCKDNTDEDKYIEENKLGIIDADVKSEDTNLNEKAKFPDVKPGEAEMYNRSFENAPPLIPHTVKGFLPIKIKNNICQSCHMPDKVEESGAVPISETHFHNWRPKPELVDGVYHVSDDLKNEETDKFNNLYFNCSQCHVPQTEVTVDIQNLFTPDFRAEFGLEKSDLNDKVAEGIK